MIGLPVLAVATVDVLTRSDQLSAPDLVELRLGNAQAQIRADAAGHPLLQDVRGERTMHFEDDGTNASGPVQPADPPDVIAAAIKDVVGEGNSLVTVREGRVRLQVGDRSVDASGTELDSADTWVGSHRLVEGTLPRGTDGIVITVPLARHAGLGVGDEVLLLDGVAQRRVRIVALVEAPDFSREVLALPGTLWPESESAPRDATLTTWFVRGPAPVTWEQVQQLNAFGATVFSRDVVLDPPPRYQVPYYVELGNMDAGSDDMITAAAVVAGLAILEVALLAGPAFAVGARRNRRHLAMVAAAGGDRRHVRAVVLASGVVIGLGASQAGVLGGIGLATVLRPVLRHYEIAYLPTLHVRPLDLLALLATGTVIAVAAALIPAVQASRQDVVAALAGRRGQVRLRAVVPVLGGVVAVVGTSLAVTGALTRNRTLVLAGAVLAELGLVATTGALVAGMGRLARWLPLSGRLAVRDAARQRSRTAPAVAAVMTAVAGAVAVSVVMATDDARHERAYRPSAPMGTAILQLGLDPFAPPDPVVLQAHVDRAIPLIRQYLPAVDVVPVYRPVPENTEEALSMHVQINPQRECPLWSQEAPPTHEQLREIAADDRCDDGGVSYGTLLTELVDDGTAVAALTDEDDPAVREALADGVALVSTPDAVWPDGMARLQLDVFPLSGGEGRTTSLAVPAIAAPLPGEMVVLPRSLLDELGAQAVPRGLVAPTSVMPTEAEVERATMALSKAGLHDPWLYVERGHPDRGRLAVLVLAVAALTVALGATGVAVGLAAADSRADLASLAAVGAAPRMRRRFAGAQGAVVTVLGTSLGLVAGGVLGVVIVLMVRHEDPRPDLSWQLVVPWPELVALAVAIPLLAVLSGYLFTRSRLPMLRRLGQ